MGSKSRKNGKKGWGKLRGVFKTASAFLSSPVRGMMQGGHNGEPPPNRLSAGSHLQSQLSQATMSTSRSTRRNTQRTEHTRERTSLLGDLPRTSSIVSNNLQGQLEDAAVKQYLHRQATLA